MARFNDTHATLVFNAGANVGYAERKPDAFLMITLLAAYAGPVQFEVWCAPKDEAAPAGVCRADAARESKMQFAAPACPGFAQNPAGDLIIKISANNVAPAADEIAGVAGKVCNVRIPLCPGCEFITVKPVGAAAEVIVHLVNDAYQR